MDLILMLLAAFGGGLVLNVMPCVLPVLTMKVFHLLEHAGDNPREHRLHGIAYGMGVLGTFLAAGFLVVALRESMRMMWGVQFQSPGFNVGIVLLLLVFGWNALGVFEFSPSVSTSSDRGGYVSSLVNGVVASIMATPCTGPGLASAAAYAFSQETPAWHTLTVFVALGAGLAFPFVLVSFVPAIGRALPRPGAWMETFKKVMGLSLLGSAVYFFRSLHAQLTPDSTWHALVFFFVVSAALWAMGHWGPSLSTLARRLGLRLVLLLAVVGSGSALLDLEPTQSRASSTGLEAVVDGHINWQPFNPALVEAARAAQRPVFMDYTADWCVNCKANERLFIEVDTIRDTLTDTGIVPMQADLTNEDEIIYDWLDELGRAGIPVYAIYMPDGSVDLLPTSITTELLDERLRAASGRFPPSGFGPLEVP